MNVNGIGELCDVDNSKRSGNVSDSYFSNTFPDRRHRFPVVRVLAALDFVQLVPCLTSYWRGKALRSSRELPWNMMSLGVILEKVGERTSWDPLRASGGTDEGEEFLAGLGIFQEDSPDGARHDRNPGFLESTHRKAEVFGLKDDHSSLGC